MVSDDCSRPDLYAEIREELEGDERFFVSQPDERLGSYRNLERVLGLVPEEAELVALCKQDDRWHQDKLEALREAAGPEFTLAYSDMNLVDEDGNRPLADLLDRAAHEPHEHDLADGRQHDHRRRLALSPAPARLRAALPGSAR